MPQDPRFQNPGGQYRLPQPSPQVQMQQQQQLLQRQRILQQQQQQQQQPMVPNEAMGLQPRQQERYAPYEHHMALLQLQQQQQTGYDASEAAQLAELQGVPLTSLGSLSNDALMNLQALVCPHSRRYQVPHLAPLLEPALCLRGSDDMHLTADCVQGGQPFEQGQLAALYSQQQQLSHQLQLSSLSDSEQAYGLQDPGMQPTWQNPDLGQGHWMP